MKDARIYIAGHTGLIGSAILNRLKKEGCVNIILRTHEELDLTRQADVESFFQEEKPQWVILAAARVGGIYANMTYPAQFLYDNLCIQTNIINASFRVGTKKLLFFGSACSYPAECPQPMKEEYLLSGNLEPTSEAYAIAKIAGMKMCQAYNQQYGTNFISVIPTNTYGPNDKFDSLGSHVIPTLIKRFHEAKINKQAIVVIWGTGAPQRDFIYVGDIADACYFLMHRYNESEVINIGSGEGVSIKELAYIIKDITGFNGEIALDTSKPDGAPRKILDITKLKNLGWQSRTSLRQGIKETYQWYIKYLGEISQGKK